MPSMKFMPVKVMILPGLATRDILRERLVSPDCRQTGDGRKIEFIEKANIDLLVKIEKEVQAAMSDKRDIF